MEYLGALEAEKLTKQKWEQYCGTPCSSEGAGVVCGDIPANNTVTSPHYPSPYPASTHQCWVQAPSPGQAVALLFTEFEVRNIF